MCGRGGIGIQGIGVGCIPPGCIIGKCGGWNGVPPGGEDTVP